MRKYVLFVVWFTILSFIVKADNIINPGYISQKTPYEFNLPQLGVGLDLPANAGFIVPAYSGKNVFLEIDDKTNYYFNLEDLRKFKNNTFSFSLSDTPKENLTLSIFDYLDFNAHIENFLEISETEEITPVNSSLKHLLSRKVINEDNEFDMHVYRYNDYVYAFYIFSDNENKPNYEKLVNSFKIKDLSKERNKYETRVKYGYFDKERKKVRDYNSENPFEKIAGRIENSTRFEIPIQGISFDMPAGWWYDVNGRNLIEEEGKTILEMDELDLLNTSLHFSLFRYKDISFMLRYSSKKNRNPVEMEQIGRVGARLYNYHKDLKINIDGIEANAFFAGSPEVGELNIWFETQNGHYCLTASNMTLDNVAVYEELINSVKVDNKENKTSSKISLVDLLQLQEKKDITLDEISFPNTTDIEAFECYFPVMSANIWLPGKPFDYTYGINSTVEKNELKQRDSYFEIDVAPDAENFFVHVGSDYMNPEFVMNISIYMTYDRYLPIEEIAKEYLRTVNNYNDDYKVIIDKAGILHANNGAELVVIVENGGTKANVIMRNEDYQFFFMITAANSEIMNKICALLYRFTI